MYRVFYGLYLLIKALAFVVCAIMFYPLALVSDGFREIMMLSMTNIEYELEEYIEGFDSKDKSS